MAHLTVIVTTPGGGTGTVEIYGDNLGHAQITMADWAAQHPTFTILDWTSR